MKFLKISAPGGVAVAIAVALISYATFAFVHTVNKKVKPASEVNKVFFKSNAHATHSTARTGTGTSTATFSIDPRPAATETALSASCQSHACDVASADPDRGQGLDPAQGQTFSPVDDVSWFAAPPAAMGGFASGADFSLGEAVGADETPDDIFKLSPSDPLSDYFGLPAAFTEATGKIAAVSTTVGGFHARHEYPFDGSNGASAVAVAAPVPEPKTYTLILGGFCAVGFMVRRRRMS